MERQEDTGGLARRRSATRFLIVIALLGAVAGVYALRFGWIGQRAEGDHLRSLTVEDFDAAVASGVVLVDFWAPWCGPCRQQAPILADVAQRVEGRAAVMKVNIDDAPQLAARFDVQSIPTLIVLRDGRPVQRFVGVQSAAALVGAIENAAAAPAE